MTALTRDNLREAVSRRARFDTGFRPHRLMEKSSGGFQNVALHGQSGPEGWGSVTGQAANPRCPACPCPSMNIDATIPKITLQSVPGLRCCWSTCLLSFAPDPFCSHAPAAAATVSAAALFSCCCQRAVPPHLVLERAEVLLLLQTLRNKLPLCMRPDTFPDETPLLRGDTGGHVAGAGGASRRRPSAAPDHRL